MSGRLDMGMRAARVGIICLLLFSLAPLQPAFAQAKWKGTVVKEGDVTIVKNPKEPIYKTPILELKEDLSIGGPHNSELGLILTFAVDNSGSIYVLDGLSDRIVVFSQSGAYVRTIGRRGQGPGELERAVSLSFNSSTGELAVLQQARRMTYFKKDGTFVRHLPFRGLTPLSGRIDSKGNIYVTCLITDDNGSNFETKKLAPDASPLAFIGRVAAPVLQRNKVKIFLPSPDYHIDRSDNLVYGDSVTYRILFFGPIDSKVFKMIVRAYDQVSVTEGEKRAALARGKLEYEFPAYHSAYRRFFLSDLGHIMIETWETAAGRKKVHDIFDAEGRFIGRIPLKPSGVTILNGKYYALEEDEDGYQYVKRYAVTWKVK